MAYVYNNDVRTTLAADVAAGAATITVNAASSPHEDPPDPGGGVAILVLLDSLADYAKREVVTYTSRTDNGDGTFTLGGVSKGQEETSDQSWSAGDHAIQSVTVQGLAENPPVDSVAGKTGAVTLSASDVGLGNVPNEDATDPANLDQAGATGGQALVWDDTAGAWGPDDIIAAGGTAITATDGGTDAYTASGLPFDGSTDLITARVEFGSANTTSSPTFDPDSNGAKNLVDRYGNAWAGLVDGTHIVQYDSGNDRYVVLDPYDVEHTIIYPNGGSESSPSSISTGTRLVETNPFPGFYVVCVPELQLDDGSGLKWSEVPWSFNSGNGGVGINAGYFDGDIVVVTGNFRLISNGYNATGHLWDDTSSNETSLPVRVHVYKIRSHT